jgi:hypothetical protein
MLQPLHEAQRIGRESCVGTIAPPLLPKGQSLALSTMGKYTIRSGDQKNVHHNNVLDGSHPIHTFQRHRTPRAVYMRARIHLVSLIALNMLDISGVSAQLLIAIYHMSVPEPFQGGLPDFQDVQ